MALDDTIAPGQTGHITDHEELATQINALEAAIAVTGNLPIATAAGALGDLAPGAAGQVLTADPSVTGKAKWANPATGGAAIYQPSGLVGDGTTGGTGNSSAIAAAVNAAYAAGGGDVYLSKPATSYLLAYSTLLSGTATYAAIVVKPGVRLICEPGTVLTAPPAGAGTYRTLIAIGDNVTDADNASVIGFIIDGQQTAPSGVEDQMGIVVCGGKNIHIENNEIRHLRGDAISHGEAATGGTNGVWVRDNYIHDCTGNPVVTAAPFGLEARNWTIEGNLCRTSINNLGGVGPGAAEAIFIAARSIGIKVLNNVLEDWGMVYIQSASRVEVAGNTITPADGGKGGVLILNDTYDIDVSNNDIDVSNSTIGTGIGMEGANISFVRIHDNEIKRNSRTTPAANTLAGIQAASTATPSDVSIRGNTIWNGATTDGTPDILIRGGGGWITVAGNICKSATTAIWVASSGVVVANNTCQLGGILVLGADPVITGNNIFSSSPFFFYGGTGVGLGVVDAPNFVVAGNHISGSVLSVSVAGATTTTGVMIGNRISLGSNAEHIHEYAGNYNAYVPNVFEGTPVVTLSGANSVGVQSVTGSRGGNAALASLLTALAKAQLIVDNSS